jgi:hypothetical protein
MQGNQRGLLQCPSTSESHRVWRLLTFRGLLDVLAFLRPGDFEATRSGSLLSPVSRFHSSKV